MISFGFYLLITIRRPHGLNIALLLLIAQGGLRSFFPRSPHHCCTLARYCFEGVGSASGEWGVGGGVGSEEGEGGGEV